jgi:glyoxylase-like metal-dependent hydrolase (beta-lactamase superfamily II)
LENFKLFKINKISDRIIRIIGVSDEIMYLVTGDKKAALIDSGVGVGNLKSLIENLTDKPVMVILTHGHVDHIAGSGAFEEIYLNSKDDDLYKHHLTNERRQMHIDMSIGEKAKCISSTDYIELQTKKCKQLNVSDIFDLGGITLEICEGAGHTLGQTTVLIKEERMLLLGDACNYGTLLLPPECTSIEEYREVMNRLNQYVEGKYDSVLLSHGTGEAPVNIINEIIKVCDDILNGNTDDIPVEFLGVKGYLAKAVNEHNNRIDGGIGNIIYNR